MPLVLERAGLGGIVSQELGLDTSPPDLTTWEELVARSRNRSTQLPIAIVGKYVESPDAYIEHREALKHAGLHHGVDVEIHWVDAEDLEREANVHQLDSLARHSRSGQDLAAAGSKGRSGPPDTRERTGALPRRVPRNAGRHDRICTAPAAFGPAEQYRVRRGEHLSGDRYHAGSKGHRSGGRHHETRRVAVPHDTGSRAARAYDQPIVYERHRHRYEFNNEYRELLTDGGMELAGHFAGWPKLVEMIELKDHPWLVGSQFHPEFKSRPERPHPLFRDFVGVAKELYNTRASDEAIEIVPSQLEVARARAS